MNTLMNMDLLDFVIYLFSTTAVVGLIGLIWWVRNCTHPHFNPHDSSRNQ